MKKLIILLLMFTLFSCKKEEIKYPQYSLTTIKYIPDSLKEKHREWVKETIRASNQHLTAGEYEDIDETIIQVERTAEDLFEVSVIGLRKQINEHYWEDLELKPNELNPSEKKILDSLTNIH